ncbi:Lrp/AsnC family transcriptional regulator [Paraglaciecola sp. 25GB23A]|jgi:DNA-binding Lrp family transcriptional regulator|uniref:Lrp/AsnC family transcriptional regulator n=1 Tax=Paraglaciecola sp. 25GB23A TaxID=3156068 RepID=UPI0032AF4AFE
MNQRRLLDTTDLAILALLYQDARLNNKDIAEQVGLAPSSCLERIKKLQLDNIILGSKLEVNLQTLGGNIQAMISVKLSDHNRATVDRLQKQWLTLAEVLSIYHMGGDIDFFVHVSVADTSHLRDFVFNQITAHSEVSHVETALVYEHSRSNTLPNV